MEPRSAAGSAGRLESSRGLAFFEKESEVAQLVQQQAVLDGPLEASSERAARVALKAQIARLEHELSGIVAGRFPYIPAPRAARPASAPAGATPARPGRARVRTRPPRGARPGASPGGGRAHRARAARAGAARTDAPGTGALQVRAPTGPGSRPGRLRGMAGQTPPRPDRDARGLVAAQALVGLSISQGVALHARPRSPDSSSSARRRLWRSVSEPTGLVLRKGYLGQEFAAAGLTPPALAHQQVRDRHAVGLRGAVEDHLRNVDLAVGDAPLELGPGEADLVGAFKSTHVLGAGRGDRGSRVHGHTPRRLRGGGATCSLDFLDSGASNGMRMGPRGEREYHPSHSPPPGGWGGE